MELQIEAQKQLKEMASALLWQEGNLAYKWHSGQHALDAVFGKMTGKLAVFECARRFGKTYFLLTKCIESCLKIPRCNIRFGTAFHEDIKEIVIPIMEEIMVDKPSFIKIHYRASGSRYVFPENGSQIVLVGLDRNPNKLRGTGLDHIIIDEAGYVGTSTGSRTTNNKLKYIYNSVIYPTMLYNPNANCALISTPPPQMDHDWIQWAIPKAKQENSFAMFTIHDNPMLSQDDIDKIAAEYGGYDSIDFRREFLCEHIVDVTKAMFPEFSLNKKEIVVERKRPPFFTHMTVIDSGYADGCGAVFCYYDFLNDKICFERDFFGQRENSEYIINNLKLTESILKYHKPTRYMDATSQLIADYSEIYQYHTSLPNKDSFQAKVNETRVLMKNGGINVSPKCQNLISHFENAIWDNQRKSPERGDHHYDCAVAAVYAIKHIDRSLNPFPRDYNVLNKKGDTVHNPYKDRAERDVEDLSLIMD